jgi:hypothetical protein
MHCAYLAAEDVASALAAMTMGGGHAVGSSIGFVVGVPIRGIIHRPVHVHLWPHTMVRPR